MFRTLADRKVYLRLMEEHLADAGVRLLSYCLMTNHVHLVAVPERGDSLSVWVRRIHGRYAQYFNAKANRTGQLWQARFFSCALSPRHLTVALRYVQQNPVRAQMVERTEEYRWSSAAAHLTGELGILDERQWRERGMDGIAAGGAAATADSHAAAVYLWRAAVWRGRVRHCGGDEDGPPVEAVAL